MFAVLLVCPGPLQRSIVAKNVFCHLEPYFHWKIHETKGFWVESLAPGYHQHGTFLTIELTHVRGLSSICLGVSNLRMSKIAMAEWGGCDRSTIWEVEVETRKLQQYGGGCGRTEEYLCW
jgi:hypothetical protein